MTREKAIDVLEKMPFCDGCDKTYPYTCDDCSDAFLMAIKALKQPQIVRCKDCKWGEPSRNEKNEPMIFCYNGDTGIEDGWLLEPNWFCAEGEPKDSN